jgi:hypothetical protein
MKLAAADIYQLYQPVRCNLRARLNKLETSPQKADAFTELLRDLGKRYEADHLKTFPAHLDISDGDFEQRSRDTIAAVSRGEGVSPSVRKTPLSAYLTSSSKRATPTW